MLDRADSVSRLPPTLMASPGRPQESWEMNGGAERWGLLLILRSAGAHTIATVFDIYQRDREHRPSRSRLGGTNNN